MGVDYLRHMRTDEVYAIEIESRGARINVYTRAYMERLARSHAVLPRIMFTVP